MAILSGREVGISFSRVVGDSNGVSVCRGTGEHTLGAADYHFRHVGIHHARLISPADRKYLRVRGEVTLLRCAMGKKYTFFSASKL